MSTKKLLLLLFLLTFTVRLVVLLGIVYCVPPSTRQLLDSPDATTYSREGWAIAQYWHGVSKEKPLIYLQYSYYNAVIYYLIGNNPLVIRIINCFLGTVSVIFIYFIAREIFDKKVAVLSSIFCALFPSMIFWQVYNLKEASYMFCLISATLIVTKLQAKDKKMNFIYILLTVPFLVYLNFLKIFIFAFFAYGVILSFFINIRKKVAWRNLIYGLCFIIIFGLISKSMHGYELFFKSPARVIVEVVRVVWMDKKPQVSPTLTQTLVSINHMRKALATGKSAYKKNVNISTPRKAIAFLPTGMTYFLFAPFPWQTKGFLQHFTIPEVLLWYLMVPFMLYGLFYAFRFKWREISCIFIYMGITIALYSLVQANIGTFYRQRVAIIPFCLIFASIGIVHFSQFIAFTLKEKKELFKAIL